MRTQSVTVELDVRLKPYIMSKWKCPTHGFYVAKTTEEKGPSNPVQCPECSPEFLGQCKGRTVTTIPYISKPRWPQKSDITPHISDKAPLHKRRLW